ncbi:MAG: tetratricopeptide repeat protein [Planctomycetota bacterium]|nr:tetratricopeptide repeat protein [Planctomycetota bacterium]
MRPLESSDSSDFEDSSDAVDSSDQPLGLSDSSVISENLFEDGVRAFQKKDFSRAILCFKEALRDNPEDENCRKNLLNSLFKAGVKEFKAKCFEDAIGRFTAILDMEPGWEQARVNLANSHMFYAQSYAVEKDDDMAEFHFIQAIECSDNFTAGLMQLGEFYLHRKRFKDAYTRFKELRDLLPQDQDALKRLAETSRQYANQFIKEKNYKSAEKLLKLARQNYKRLNQRSFDVERGFGIVYFQTERYGDAADAFRDALEINEDHNVTRRDLALTLLHIANTVAKKKLKRAEAAYKEALSLNILNSEGHVSGLVNLGALYFNHKKFKDAIEPLREAIEIDEKHTEARAYLIRVHIVLGFRLAAAEDYDAATEEYGKCLEIDPKSFRALVRLGYVCYVTQNYEMAADWFKRGLAIKPDDVRTQNNYEACLKLSQADEEDLYVMMGELEVEDLAAPEEIADEPELDSSAGEEEPDEDDAPLGNLKMPDSIASDPELSALVSSGLETLAPDDLASDDLASDDLASEDFASEDLVPEDAALEDMTGDLDLGEEDDDELAGLNFDLPTEDHEEESSEDAGTVSDEELDELADLPELDSEESDDGLLNLPLDLDALMEPEEAAPAPKSFEAPETTKPKADAVSFEQFTSAKNPFASMGNDGAFLNMQSLVDADSEADMPSSKELDLIPDDELDDFLKNINEDEVYMVDED